MRVLAGSCTQNSTPFHIFSFFMKTHIAIVQNDAYMKFVDAVFSVQQEPPVAPDDELEAEK